jgi:intermediate peptidase
MLSGAMARGAGGFRRISRVSGSVASFSNLPPASASLPLSLDRGDGLFALKALERPEGFLTLADDAIRRSDDLRAAVVKDNLVGHPLLQVLDAMSDTICLVIDAAELCRNVHPDRKYRDAAEECFDKMAMYISELNTDVALYEKLFASDMDETVRAALNLEQRRMSRLLREEFETNGIHLDEKGRCVNVFANFRTSCMPISPPTSF